MRRVTICVSLVFRSTVTRRMRPHYVGRLTADQPRRCPRTADRLESRAGRRHPNPGELCHNAAVIRGIRAVALTVAACNVYDPGLLRPDGASNGDVDASRLEVEDAAAPVDSRPDRPQVPADRYEPPGVVGAPGVVGCADGTREGFASVEDWPS